jgi:hypothetical protein
VTSAADVGAANNRNTIFLDWFMAVYKAGAEGYEISNYGRVKPVKNALYLTTIRTHMCDRKSVDCLLHGYARSKPVMLKPARWFRMAAHQGLAKAQWELGEWFRRGVFCDVHVPFARQYIRRAARQGHAEPISPLKEMCSCVYCDADAAPLKCSTCLATMYCDAACSKKHWRRGGGVSEVCEAALPHKKTCPRTFDDPCE